WVWLWATSPTAPAPGRPWPPCCASGSTATRWTNCGPPRAELPSWAGWGSCWAATGPGAGARSTSLGRAGAASPRWSSRAAAGGGQLRGAELGGQRRGRARLAAEAEVAGERLVAAVRDARGGWWKSRVARRLVRVVRALLALREHPKFLLVRMLGLLREVIQE